MAVITAVLAPMLLSYTENSAKQKDESISSEIIRAVELAITDADVLDEVLRYEIANNFITYTDSSGEYAKKVQDEEFWAPDGAGRAVTITFNPSNSKYVLADGIVNDITFGNGSVITPARIMQPKGMADPIQCKFNEMSNGLSMTASLYNSIRQTLGDSVKINSATYKNSSYTIFIYFEQRDGTTVATVNGSFNGTNLSDGCPASIGSGTDGFVNDIPNGNKSGTQNSEIDGSALAGGGSVSYKSYPTLENEFLDPQKFWAFCHTLNNITEINIVSNGQQEGTDVSASGTNSILAWTENSKVYVSASKMGYKFMVAENASGLFDAKIMLSTDPSMNTTTISLKPSIYFKDSAGHISIGGSYSPWSQYDLYDVDNDGNFSDRYATISDANMRILINAQEDY